MMQIIIRIITSIIISFSVPILISIIKPRIEKNVNAAEEKAKHEKSVHMYKKLANVFIILLVFLNIIGILIVALPKFITEYLEFNYIVTICVWWIPILFDDIVCCVFSTKATYDDEKITVKKIFHRPKVYYFSDITAFTKAGNLKVETTKGIFMLFNMFVGTQSLREFIAKKQETKITQDE